MFITALLRLNCDNSALRQPSVAVIKSNDEAALNPDYLGIAWPKVAVELVADHLHRIVSTIINIVAKCKVTDSLIGIKD